MAATVKQRLGLTLGTFVVSMAGMAIFHEGGAGFIVAGTLTYGAFKFADEVFGTLHSDDEPNRQNERTGQQKSAMRALLGMRQRETIVDADITNRESSAALPPVRQKQRRLSLSDILASGWRPSSEKFLMAILPNGQPAFVDLTKGDITHIALAGATRQGKTSIIRQILTQLFYIKGHICVLLDPHYTPYDPENDEDWTPFTPHLHINPLETKEYEDIERVLRWGAEDLLNQRRRLRSQSKRVGKDVWFLIDEYPAIIGKRPKVQDYVADLLREGGKYKIHLVIASQDFQVKTAFPNLGSGVRDNLTTCFYVGGDKVTVREILETSISSDEEASLGKGPIYLRCETVKKASQAFTPFCDNDAVYELVGPSTYTVDEDEEQDTEPLDFMRSSASSASASAQKEADSGGNSSASASSASLPSGWTQKEAILAREIYKQCGDKDTVLKALAKKGTIGERRRELNMILQEEN